MLTSHRPQQQQQQHSPSLSYILFFDEVSRADVRKVGGKNASLGEMRQHLTNIGSDGDISDTLQVPNGFAVTAGAFREHLTHNHLEGRINSLLTEILEHGDVMDTNSTAIRRLIVDAPLPTAVAKDLSLAYTHLQQEYGADCDVAVRSSATAEDLPEDSFAGQLETFLNISGLEKLQQACVGVFASLFTSRAISYRIDKGLGLEIQGPAAIAVSVGVQKMVRSDGACAGVAFTLDTESGFRDVVVVNSSYGLGESVVSGSVNPDEFFVHKPLLLKRCLAALAYTSSMDRDEKHRLKQQYLYRPVLKKRLGSKMTKIVYKNGSATTTAAACVSGTAANIAAAIGANTAINETVTVPVPVESREVFSLTDDELLILSRQCVRIEEHYNSGAMDIEWAKDASDGCIYIVQARPETVHSSRAQKQLEEEHLVQHYSLLPLPPVTHSTLGTGSATADSSRLAAAHVPTTAVDTSNLYSDRLLFTGVGLGRKIATGKVKIIPDLTYLQGHGDISHSDRQRIHHHGPNQMSQTVEEGDVIVTRMTNPDWVPYMHRAAGIITELGGRTCHAAIICRELGLPGVIGCTGAMDILSKLVMDAECGHVHGAGHQHHEHEEEHAHGHEHGTAGHVHEHEEKHAHAHGHEHGTAGHVHEHEEEHAHGHEHGTAGHIHEHEEEHAHGPSGPSEHAHGHTGAEASVTVTIDCSKGGTGSVYMGSLPFKITSTPLPQLASLCPQPPAEFMINTSDPDEAFRTAVRYGSAVAGVGLARIEFIVSNTIQAHPLALLHPDQLEAEESERQREEEAVVRGVGEGEFGTEMAAAIKATKEEEEEEEEEGNFGSASAPGIRNVAAMRRLARPYLTHSDAPLSDYFVIKLAEEVGTVAAAFYPKPVVVRMSDFKSNEYRALFGGEHFEPIESNPALGYRGVRRYYEGVYREAFALECAAMYRLRCIMGLDNVRLMLPFVRSVEEAQLVTAVMSNHGLTRRQLTIQGFLGIHHFDSIGNHKVMRRREQLPMPLSVSAGRLGEETAAAGAARGGGAASSGGGGARGAATSSEENVFSISDVLAAEALTSQAQALELYMMVETPANCLGLTSYLPYFDGFSIGSNDLTQLTLGVDRDGCLDAGGVGENDGTNGSEGFEPVLQLYDERDPAVKELILKAIHAVGPANHIGICGAAPSDDPEYCLWLVRNGISSVSLSADAFASTFLHVAHAYAHDEGAEVSHGVTAISTDTVPAPTPTSTHIYAPASVRSKDAEPARVNISRPPHRCHAAAEDVSRAASAG